MSKCPECSTEMKPLFAGEYCPNSCDKPEVLAKRKADAKAEREKALHDAIDRLNQTVVGPGHPWFGFFPPSTTSAANWRSSEPWWYGRTADQVAWLDYVTYLSHLSPKEMSDELSKRSS